MKPKSNTGVTGNGIGEFKIYQFPHKDWDDRIHTGQTICTVMKRAEPMECLTLLSYIVIALRFHYLSVREMPIQEKI